MLLNKVVNRIFLIVFLSLTASTFSNASVCDSIGVERKDGKLFILHRITAGETLYSISKKYNASVDDVKKANPDWAQGLQVGQIVKVPTTLPATTSPTITTASTQKHIVASGETLYSITTKYNISVDELKKANPGLTSTISVGQELTIPTKGATVATATTTKPATSSKVAVNHQVAAGETLYSISKKYNVGVDDIKKANPGIGSLQVGQVVVVPGVDASLAVPTVAATTTTTTPKPATTTPTTTNVEADTIQLQQDKARLETMQTQTQPIKTVPASDFKKITESGFADVMADNLDSPKYLAYHKTAPVGTIIQLLNESTGIKVYVRVVGKLTDTGADGKTIIRISKKAYERLGGTGTRFAASLMYIP
jgi:LysM repeat protein